METSAFKIRKMTADDVESAMNLSSAEGWNQTANDWRFFISLPQNICLAVEYQKKIIATATAVNYAEKISWIGMVLVQKDFRGRGISRLLLNEVFQNLGGKPSVKLDATPQGKKVYRSLGFVEEYQIARMICERVTDFRMEKREIVPKLAGPEDLPGIVALDALTFGAERNLLIEMLVKTYPQKAIILLKKNQIAGFALGRDGNRYHHIGPVTAATIEGAKNLIMHAMPGLTGMPVIIDVPCDKEPLIVFLSSLGFSVQRYFTRMYRQSNPMPGNPDQVFAICGPEFG